MSTSKSEDNLPFQTPQDDIRSLQSPAKPRANLPNLIVYLQTMIRFVDAHIANLNWLATENTIASTSTLHDFSYAPVSPLQLDVPASLTDEAKFATFAQAFQHCQRRLVLIGPPGAGKTTSLLLTLRLAAQERLSNPSAPIPLLAYIYSWQPSTPIMVWVRDQKQNRHVPIDEEPLLYLFDGLDELGTAGRTNPADSCCSQIDPRALFLRFVQKQLAKAELVITCREREYYEIRQYLLPYGAVRLLPLQREQIKRFLTAMGQTALWDTILTDPSLLTLAQTPLLLALLIGATAERKPNAQQLIPINETNLFDFYISSRFYHERIKQANKITGLPFEEQATRNIVKAIAFQMMADPHLKTTITLEDIAEAMICVQRETSKGLQFAEAIICVQREACKRLPWSFEIRFIQNYPYYKRKFLQPAADFAAFAQSMHLMHINASGQRQFCHLKLRDDYALEVALCRQNADKSDMRLSAAWSLAKFSHPAAVPLLLEACKDRDDAVRSRALWELLRYNDPAAIPDLLEILDTPDYPQSYLAVDALAKIDSSIVVPVLLEKLNHPNDTIRHSIVSALGTINTPTAISALLQALKDPIDYVRRSAVKALGELKASTASPGLLEVLDNADPGLCEEVASALIKISDPAVLPALLQALKDPRHNVRGTAAYALGKLHDLTVVPILQEAFKDNKYYKERWRVASALIELNIHAIIPLLQDNLKDSDHNMRLFAVSLLQNLSDPTVAPALQQALADPDYRVRKYAAYALEERKDPATIPALILALRDKDRRVRKAALSALRQA